MHAARAASSTLPRWQSHPSHKLLSLRANEIPLHAPGERHGTRPLRGWARARAEDQPPAVEVALASQEPRAAESSGSACTVWRLESHACRCQRRRPRHDASAAGHSRSHKTERRPRGQWRARSIDSRAWCEPRTARSCAQVDRRRGSHANHRSFLLAIGLTYRPGMVPR